MGKKKLAKNDVDKIIHVYLPSNKYARWRWITKYNPDTKRFYARTPKIDVKIRDFSKKRNMDYGKETILPKDSYVSMYSNQRKSRKTRR